MKGIIRLKDTISVFDEFPVKVFTSRHAFELSIYVDENNGLESRLESKLELEKYIELKNYFSILINAGDDFEKDTFLYVSENYDNIYNMAEYIVLDFEIMDVKEYIKNNPNILKKKIVLPGKFDINDYDKLMKLYEEYEDIIDNIYVDFQCNENYTKIGDVIKTIDEIENIVKDIEILNLSPMEKIMYVYDLVRDRVYKLEEDNESMFISRDLSEVLFGDKIVCVGYANLFFTILKRLNIESSEVMLKRIDDEYIGHKRNVIYVKDEKYNIDGVYYFDATWDSKKNDNDNEYLYSYKYFAKPRSFMETEEKYEDIYFKEKLDEFWLMIKKIVASGNYAELGIYADEINYLSNIVNGKNLLEDEEMVSMVYTGFDDKKFLEELKKIISKFYAQIPAETMLDLLLNVRKLQYYKNPEKYPFSCEDIYQILKKSGWDFENTRYNGLDVYNLIFENIKLSMEDEFIEYMEENNKYREISQVQLTKVLSKYLEKRKTGK